MSAWSARAPPGTSRLPRLSTLTSWPAASARFTHERLMMPVPPMNRTFIRAAI